MRKGTDNGEALLNSCNYRNLTSLKRALRRYNKLQELAYKKGNYAAETLVMDLKSALDLYGNNPKVLTDKQRRAIILHLILGYTEFEVADMVGVSQTAIVASISGGLKRMSQFLVTGKCKSRFVFSEADTKKLISLYTEGYSPRVIAESLQLSPKTVSNKIRVLKDAGKLRRRFNYGEEQA